MMAEAVRHGGCARNLVGAERSRDRGWKDISLARVWRMPEKRGRHAKILAQHFVWRMLEPVGKQEGVVFVEVAIIKDQKEFAAVRTESLNGVGNARWKIPEIADAYIVDEVVPFRIDGGNTGGAVKHVGPLSGLVPMQLAHATGVEPHIHAGHTLGNAQLALRHLTGPTARRQPHMRIGK